MVPKRKRSSELVNHFLGNPYEKKEVCDQAQHDGSGPVCSPEHQPANSHPRIYGHAHLQCRSRAGSRQSLPDGSQRDPYPGWERPQEPCSLPQSCLPTQCRRLYHRPTCVDLVGASYQGRRRDYDPLRTGVSRCVYSTGRLSVPGLPARGSGCAEVKPCFDSRELMRIVRVSCDSYRVHKPWASDQLTNASHCRLRSLDLCKFQL
jgi:hypothetical protein